MTTPTAAPATWEDRHPNEQGELEDAQVAPEMNSETLGRNERSIDPLTRFATKLNTRPKPELPMFNFHSHHIFHDDKPSELADRFVTTQEGDLDCWGRKLRQGS